MSILQEQIIKTYKNFIANNFVKEAYKWELIERFKGKPNLDTVDFVDEMQQIKLSNLVYHNAKSVQKHLWKTHPEEYRAALGYLFDEQIDLRTRIGGFQDRVSNIYRKVEPKLSHHHDERTIAALLSIKYPEVYPIYKSSYYEAYCNFLGISPAKKDEKYVHYISLIRDLVQVIKLDGEVISLVEGLKTVTCYPDPEYLLLAQDILYQYFREIAKESEKTNVRYWLYSPGEQAKKWDEFYESGCMALGWDALEDLKNYISKEDIKTSLLEAYGGTTDKKNDTTANYEFANKIEVGDIIIVKQGLNKLLGYGEVTTDYYYDDDALDYKHRRDVNWIKSGVWLVKNDSLVLKTLTDVSSYKSPLDESVNYPKYLLAIMNDKPKEPEPMSLAVLQYKKQIILQGPPGTGKTREAKQLAQMLLQVDDIENSDQFKLIQFHPSYTYEDFVRGIVAKPNPDGEGIVYEAENKVLAAFAERAYRNYIQSQNRESIINLQLWIDDSFDDFKSYVENELSLNDIDLTNGITLFAIENDNFRYGKNWGNPSRINFIEFKKLIRAVISQDFDLNSNLIPKEISIHAHYRNTYYLSLLKKFFNKYNFKENVEKETEIKNYVLIIDEINRANLSSVLGELIYALEYRGKAVESMYAVNGSKQLILPPNLYIIGTMNTADRSVGHIDYAIRRRFAFVDVFPKSLEDDLDVYFYTEAFKAVSEMFILENVISDFKPEDVALGQSYFMVKKEENITKEQADEIFKLKLEYEIIPILKEYSRDGIFVKDISSAIADLANKTTM